MVHEMGEDNEEDKHIDMINIKSLNFNSIRSVIIINMTAELLKQSIITIYPRQAFTASILRPLHQVYWKMLNHIKIKSILTKMAPLKYGFVRRRVRGIEGEWHFHVGEGEDHTYQS